MVRRLCDNDTLYRIATNKYFNTFNNRFDTLTSCNSFFNTLGSHVCLLAKVLQICYSRGVKMTTIRPLCLECWLLEILYVFSSHIVVVMRFWRSYVTYGEAYNQSCLKKTATHFKCRSVSPTRIYPFVGIKSTSFRCVILLSRKVDVHGYAI